MLTSVATLLLMVTSATAYGGTRCLDPSQSSDSCQNNECRITGGSRRRVSRVGATFCMGGVYKNVWYKTTVTEAQCNATPTSASVIAASVEASLPGSSTAERRGLCRETQAKSTHNPGESQIITCVGVPDGQDYVRKAFEGPGCNASRTKWTSPNHFQKINGKPAPCFCSNTEQEYNPVSECGSCDTSEHACRTQDLCTKAMDGRCSWANNACSCKSGMYKDEDVCIGGVVHTVYYGTHTNCKNKVLANTVKRHPTGGRRRRHGSNCETTNATAYMNKDVTGAAYYDSVDHTKRQMKYQSRRYMDCTGVADGGYPRQRHYAQPMCGGTPMHLNFSQQSVYPEWNTKANCGCVSEKEMMFFRSQCSNCEGGGVECSNRDACLDSQEGTCSWMGATTKSCKCASKLFSSRSMCWNNEPHTFYYDNSNYATCKARTAASVTFRKYQDVSTDSSWTQCRHEGDSNIKKQYPNVTHKKEMTCQGVTNGNPARTAYYRDSACTVLDHVGAAPSWVTEQECRCELYLGCKAGNTFEKYWCDAANGTVAIEYTDSKCTTPNGVNRTMPSFTDALNPGVCGVWPPLALKPNWDASVRISCSAANTPPGYNHYVKKMGVTGLCQGTPDNVGHIADCFCKEEYFFKAMAAEKNVQVAGEVTMTVTNAAAAVQDVKFKKSVKETIADTAGVSPKSVVNLVLTASRRLSAEPRELTSGSIKASYLIVVPKVMATEVTSSLTAVTVATLQTAIQQKATSAGLVYTVTVTAKTVPTSKPATVSMTASGVIEPEGVSADGTAATTTGAPTGTTGGTSDDAIRTGISLMVALAAAVHVASGILY